MSTRPSEDEKGQNPTNIVSSISQFADDNLTIIRNISTGLALAGVVIISRSIKLVSCLNNVAI
uniref:Uncharacterized protein n=1 Tax=Esox lucius TaxID=8010 RepID=A0AAY5L6N3_ESOLU